MKKKKSSKIRHYRARSLQTIYVASKSLKKDKKRTKKKRKWRNETEERGDEREIFLKNNEVD